VGREKGYNDNGPGVGQGLKEIICWESPSVIFYSRAGGIPERQGLEKRGGLSLIFREKNEGGDFEEGHHQ